MTRGATTGAVTAWTEPEEMDKRQTLSAVYEMAGIRPPSERVERWIVAGWPHVCHGLQVADIQEAFVLCMAGRLKDENDRQVTLDLYGRQFSLQDFARVVSAYRYRAQLEAIRRRSAEAEARNEAYERRRREKAAEEAFEAFKARLRRAYDNPDGYEDYGGLVYTALDENGLLGEVADYSDEISDRAAKRLKGEYDHMRAVFDREYRQRMANLEPDIQGETVRRWIELQREKGVTAEGMLKKLKY